MVPAPQKKCYAFGIMMVIAPLDPEPESVDLKLFLDRIIKRYLNIKSLRRQLTGILEWQHPARIEALNVSSYFFRLTVYSISRTILVELAALLQRKEDRSLITWIRLAKNNPEQLEPTRLAPDYPKRDRVAVSAEEYVRILNKQLAQIRAESKTIERIRSRRNKAIVHMEDDYFDEPEKVNREFTLSDDDLDRLFAVLDDVLSKQHNYVFRGDLQMEVHSGGHVDSVLVAARAWRRAWRNTRHIDENGFRPVDYTQDEFSIGQEPNA